MSPTDDVADATRRTYLATERTELAWWRTGLTALAVALAIGRVVPELGGQTVQWPYTLVGAAFGLYGVALLLYGTLRAREVGRAVAQGDFAEPSGGVLGAFTAAGVILGIATVALIVID